ncbi:MAG: electron transfer flavoprotein subunit alpha/FixB family protein [Marinoscillum sp.]|uniref:electron transfer flavoprotein subunit alpha/FixB family protein n=1 Tax=Marinoscillum sp. TaxID=2024838 RepID=UPI0032F978B1
MSALVFVEIEEGVAKKSSLEAVSYAAQVDGSAVAIVFGGLTDEEASKIGAAGATKILNASDEKLATPNIMAYASAIAEAMEKESSSLLVLAKSSLGDPVSARVAIKTGASLATNVVDLPDTNGGFKVKCSIYTGKAFAMTSLSGDKKILGLKKNAIAIKEDGGSATVESFSPSLNDADFKVKVTSREKATGEILLPEADLVVSGGRGLKGPENWGMIEELAKTIGAATGCSKPVSDMDWRPHHEHVGQTGVKVSPSLYIAVGISGAIQHLAGVNSSKYILVINKDGEAPFFKAADYGVVGDAFEVIPKLTEAIKAQQG